MHGFYTLYMNFAAQTVMLCNDLYQSPQTFSQYLVWVKARRLRGKEDQGHHLKLSAQGPSLFVQWL